MDADHARDRLTEERERLQELHEEYERLREEAEEDNTHELSTLDQHQADAGSETFDRERDLSLLEQVEGELADVEHALRRIDDGTYGTCEACGEPIPDERLEAMPAARFCVVHQASAERETRTVGSAGDTA